MDDHFALFALPLSTHAFQELQDILLILAELILHHQEHDLWLCRWGSGAFSSKGYYVHRFSSLQTTNWIWLNKCIPKIKGFIWLLNCDRLNTKDIGQKTLQPGWTAVLRSLQWKFKGN